ncbi:MAG: hypothetical protein ABJA80_15070 [bacterium]
MIPAGTPEDLGRIVVVAAGFALWKGGKCISAARWADIQRVRGYRSASDPETAVRLALDLTDGTVLELREAAPGFDLFLDRASATLPGLLPFAAWHPALVLAPAGDDGTVIFARKPVRVR